MVAKTVRAAGGVVYRRAPEGVEVVLVHRPHYDDWSLPKGKLDAGEDPLDAALREVREESGLECRVEGELPPIDYTDHKGRPKHVRYWLMGPLDDQAQIGASDSEVDLVQWLPLAEGQARLTYPLDREVLRSAATRIGAEVVPAPSHEYLAAVDLGSNSFRLVVARTRGDTLEAVDGLREGVRLAASLDPDRNLTEEGQQRALEALARFGQRVRSLSPDKVRAVGTNTLRKARNRDEFLERAEAVLGHPIEIVSGREEARLIYTGVWGSVPPVQGRRLVVDIGGGSTELIVGEAHQPGLAESLFMGCVSWSQQFFRDGRLDREAFRKATLAARFELQPVARSFRRLGWREVYGASGTIKAVDALLDSEGWSDGGITYAGMKKLRKALIARKSIDKLRVSSLSPDRARVLPGGLAILMGVFKALEIDRMHSSSGALREGVLYDLLGRIHHRDVRDETIQRFVERFEVDREQAHRVADTAIRLLDQVVDSWSLDRERASRFLVWAAQLHEIGLAISHGGYQKHGAYLVEHSEMPGFGRDDQLFLSRMILGHRRKIRVRSFGRLASSRQEALRLTLLIRLGVLLNRSRSAVRLPATRLRAEGPRLSLDLPEDWLKQHPLTREDLLREQSYFAEAGYSLRIDQEVPK